MINETVRSRIIFDVPTDKIDEPYGIRHFYEEDALKDLTNSVKGEGVMQPILVVKSSKAGRYSLVVGSRRLKAAKRNAFLYIPGILLDNLEDKQIKILALQENIHRKDLTPFEEAWAMFDLVHNEKLGISGAAKSLRIPESAIRRRLKLFSLPPEVKALIADKKLGFDRAEALVSMVTDPQLQIEFAAAAVFHRFSVDEFRQYMSDHLAEKVKAQKLLRAQKAAEEPLALQEKSAASLAQKAKVKRANVEARMLEITKTMTAQKVIMRIRLMKRLVKAIFSSIDSRKAEDIVNVIVEMRRLRDELDSNLKKIEEEYHYLLALK